MSLHLVAGIDFPSQLPTATTPYFLLGLNAGASGSFARPRVEGPACSAAAKPRSSMRARKARAAISRFCINPRAWNSTGRFWVARPDLTGRLLS